MLRIYATCIALIGSVAASAHPTGNLVTIGHRVYWSYVDPIDDPNHHACIMSWSPGNPPRVLIRSEFAASDFMLSVRDGTLYILERRYLAESESHEIRLLHKAGTKPVEQLWDWMPDTARIGEGGFFPDASGALLFARYPQVYRLRQGGVPEPYFKMDAAVVRLRGLTDGSLLLLGEDQAWHTRVDGIVLESWTGLLLENVPDPPLARNVIFDLDYRDGDLLLAYWGDRSFTRLARDGSRQVLTQLTEPLTPHWVVSFKCGALLFASRMAMDGTNPQPYLVYKDRTGKEEVVWEP